MNVAPPPAPKYSLAYLHFLATKGKKESDRANGRDSNPEVVKRQRSQVPPTVTESLSALLAEMS